MRKEDLAVISTEGNFTVYEYTEDTFYTVEKKNNILRINKGKLSPVEMDEKIYPDFELDGSVVHIGNTHIWHELTELIEIAECLK